MKSTDEFSIPIAEIGDGELLVERAIRPEWAAEALDDTELEVEPGAKLTVRCYRTGTDVVVRGRIEGSGKTECGRCLGEAHVDLGMDVHVLFSANAARANGDDVSDLEEGDGEMDVLPHDGVELELGPVVREQLILALPMRPLCREDCKGLCDQCGHDLNLGACAHQAEPKVDPRLVKLAGLRGKPSA